MDLVPYSHEAVYSFEAANLPQTTQLVPLGQGEFTVVHIQIEATAIERFVASIVLWFDERDEVIFVDQGISSKLEQCYIVLEWEECQPDSLFLRILETTDFIVDFSIYVRSEEV